MSMRKMFSLIERWQSVIAAFVIVIGITYRVSGLVKQIEQNAESLKVIQSSIVLMATKEELRRHEMRPHEDVITRRELEILLKAVKDSK